MSSKDTYELLKKVYGTMVKMEARLEQIEKVLEIDPETAMKRVYLGKGSNPKRAYEIRKKVNKYSVIDIYTDLNRIKATDNHIELALIFHEDDEEAPIVRITLGYFYSLRDKLTNLEDGGTLNIDIELSEKRATKVMGIWTMP